MNSFLLIFLGSLDIAYMSSLSSECDGFTSLVDWYEEASKHTWRTASVAAETVFSYALALQTG